MANGSFKIWVKYVGGISVNWDFSAFALTNSFSINRYGAVGTPCYPYGCAEVAVTGTSSGTFYMMEDGTEWLYIQVDAGATDPLIAEVSLTIVDDSGTVYNNTASGIPTAVISYGGIYSFDGYIPQGNVTISATSGEY